MNNKTIKTFKIISLIIALGFGAGAVSAALPANPGVNSMTLLNVGPTAQIKTGGLDVALPTTPSGLVIPSGLAVGCGTIPCVIPATINNPDSLAKLDAIGLTITKGFGVLKPAYVKKIITSPSMDWVWSPNASCSLEAMGTARFAVPNNIGPVINLMTTGASRVSASKELEIAGTNGSNIYAPNSDLYLLAGNNKTLNLGANNIESQVVIKDGKVGIGTNNPLASLHIAGANDIYKGIILDKYKEYNDFPLGTTVLPLRALKILDSFYGSSSSVNAVRKLRVVAVPQSGKTMMIGSCVITFSATGTSDYSCANNSANIVADSIINVRGGLANLQDIHDSNISTDSVHFDLAESNSAQNIVGFSATGNGNISMGDHTDGAIKVSNIDIGPVRKLKILSLPMQNNDSITIGSCVINFSSNASLTEDYDCSDNSAQIILFNNGSFLSLSSIAAKIALITDILDPNISNLHYDHAWSDLPHNIVGFTGTGSGNITMADNTGTTSNININYQDSVGVSIADQNVTGSGFAGTGGSITIGSCVVYFDSSTWGTGTDYDCADNGAHISRLNKNTSAVAISGLINVYDPVIGGLHFSPGDSDWNNGVVAFTGYGNGNITMTESTNGGISVYSPNPNRTGVYIDPTANANYYNEVNNAFPEINFSPTSGNSNYKISSWPEFEISKDNNKNGLFSPLLSIRSFFTGSGPHSAKVNVTSLAHSCSRPQKVCVNSTGIMYLCAAGVPGVMTPCDNF